MGNNDTTTTKGTKTMKTANRVTLKPWPNNCGNFGRDGRRTFSTQDLGRRGIGVRIDDQDGRRVHYEIVTGTTNHASAYEVALNHYLKAGRVGR